jgi:hypothetical protein
VADRIELPKDGTSWWNRRGITVSLTVGEINHNLAPGSTESQLLASQEAIDARRLIKLGKAQNDQEMIEIGQARLRTALGRPTIEDLDL